MVFAQGPAALEAVLTDTLEDAGNEMNTLARLCVQQAQVQWRELDEHMAWCRARIPAAARAAWAASPSVATSTCAAC